MGRPRQGDEVATAAIRVRVTPAQRQAIQQAAEVNQTSPSGVIRDAVNAYVADYGDRPVFRGTKPGGRSHNTR